MSPHVAAAILGVPAAIFSVPAAILGVPAAIFSVPAAIFGVPVAILGVLVAIFSVPVAILGVRWPFWNCRTAVPPSQCEDALTLAMGKSASVCGFFVKWCTRYARHHCT